MTLALLSCGTLRRPTRTGHEPRRSHHDGSHRQLLQEDQPVQGRRARGGARAGQEERQEARGQEARRQEGAGQEEGAFCRVPRNAVAASRDPRAQTVAKPKATPKKAPAPKPAAKSAKKPAAKKPAAKKAPASPKPAGPRRSARQAGKPAK